MAENEEDFVDEDGLEEEGEARDDLENIVNPFDPAKIKVSRKVVPISSIIQRIKHSEIDLSPDFQRRARIWDTTRKSRLIESILLRIPLPVFYVASDEDDNWRVVDGLQRITTISDFIQTDQDQNFRLKGLEYLQPYEGLDFDNLPRSIQRRINETELNINVIESGTPENVMFNIFRRLNTGGISLNSQEIRNALHPGPVREFLVNLAARPSFIQATSGGVNDMRMGARELALRFCAFHLGGTEAYRDDLDSFLNSAMDTLNGMSEKSKRSLIESFDLGMNRSFEIFGDAAFRKMNRSSSRRTPVNRALFEAQSVNLASFGEAQYKKTLRNRDSIFEDMYRWFNSDFAWSITASTGSRLAVSTRFATIKEVLEGK